ncbi:hypothetical protein ACUN24_20525 [Pedobacter sp. WC2501]|uniref:hypothetical protein n=1 Tax=Pedobacter sp. WC2501 TaxID=3461400 RepID=UPI0040459563
MKELLILRLFNCDNGLTITITDPQQKISKVSPIWFEGDPKLDLELILQEVAISESPTAPYSFYITGWSTRMTKAKFYFYLEQRIIDVGGSVVENNIIGKFYAHSLITNKLDSSPVFNDAYILFNFNYCHKFWDSSGYQYKLNINNIKEDFNILTNYNSNDFLKTADLIYYNQIPSVIRLLRKDDFPPHQLDFTDKLVKGNNKVLFTCNQYGDSSADTTTNVGIGKTWFTLFRYGDSMICNVEYYAMTVGYFLAYESYLIKS